MSECWLVVKMGFITRPILAFYQNSRIKYVDTILLVSSSEPGFSSTPDMLFLHHPSFAWNQVLIGVKQIGPFLTIL